MKLRIATRQKMSNDEAYARKVANAEKDLAYQQKSYEFVKQQDWATEEILEEWKKGIAKAEKKLAKLTAE
jgi:hypothetical protein